MNLKKVQDSVPFIFIIHTKLEKFKHIKKINLTKNKNIN